MKSNEKAVMTRKRNEAARKARDQERRNLISKMKYSCIEVLDDPVASSADKIKAVEILHELTERR